MKSLPFVSSLLTRQRGPRGARTAASVALGAALALGLGACTPSSPAPPVTNAPDTTSGVVRIAALNGDADALLQARASVQVLNAAGVKAQLTGTQTVSSHDARAQLAGDKVDLVFGGAEEWLVSATAAERATASGSTAPASTGASPGSAEASADAPGDAEADATAGSTPSDQGSATDAVSATLDEGLAVGTAALGERRLAAVTTKSVAALHTLESVATLPAFCPSGRLAAPRDWVGAAGTAWESRSGCAPRETTGTADTTAALELLVGGKAELAIARSNDPRIVAWGLRSLQDPGNTLGADPLLGVIASDRVGKDALEKLSKLAFSLSGENWDQLQRLQSESGVSDADLTAWLKARSLVSEAGPSTAPSGS
ncbi:hypothetical protein [Galactobacter valiniphilus]|uniref:hypothetical protein n=1 Tax=Galactobacter valiniphilus TaxID=2676122 RepID=UPI00373710F8